MDVKKIESQYQKEGTITFDIEDDKDFIILLIALLREKVRQKENEIKMKAENGDDAFNINLVVIDNFIENMKAANESLAKEVITEFVMSEPAPKEPSHYGKICKKCHYNIKAYYGNKENPCHRCGEVN